MVGQIQTRSVPDTLAHRMVRKVVVEKIDGRADSRG
jgi:hypothetical protein